MKMDIKIHNKIVDKMREDNTQLHRENIKLKSKLYDFTKGNKTLINNLN